MMVSARVLAKQRQLHEVGARPRFRVMENSMRSFVALLTTLQVFPPALQTVSGRAYKHM
jgi:hypothetical protein